MSFPSVSLCEICEKESPITYGILQPGPDIEDGVPYVRPSEIKNGVIDELSIRRTTQKIADKYKKSRLKGGDLLITIVGTIGSIAQVPNSLEGGNITQSSARVRIDGKIAVSSYVQHFLRSEYANRQYLAAKLGVAVPRLNLHHVRDLQIPLPPLAKQKRIAGILDAADGLRAKRRAALAQLDTLLQSTFLDLFGDPVTNPKGWEKVRFGDLLDQGPQNGLYKPSKLYGRGTRILRIDGFYDGRVRPLTSLKRVEISDAERATYGLKANDVVINRVNSRQYLGKSAIVPKLDEPVVFESNMMRCRLDGSRIDALFAVEYLQSRYVKNQILNCCKDAVNQSSINQKDVGSFDFYLPPLSLQRRFASIVESVERQKARHREHLAQLDTLFASLQQRAFKGEL